MKKKQSVLLDTARAVIIDPCHLHQHIAPDVLAKLVEDHGATIHTGDDGTLLVEETTEEQLGSPKRWAVAMKAGIVAFLCCSLFVATAAAEDRAELLKATAEKAKAATQKEIARLNDEIRIGLENIALYKRTSDDSGLVKREHIRKETDKINQMKEAVKAYKTRKDFALPGPHEKQWATGMIIRPWASVEITQVMDATTFVGSSRYGEADVVYEGFDTTGYADGQKYKFKCNAIEIVGPKRFSKTIGGVRTMLIVRPFDKAELAPYMEAK